MTFILMIFTLINPYSEVNIWAGFIYLARYIPLLFLVWIIYIIWAKKDQYLDIILYGIYTAILGMFTGFIIWLSYLYAPSPGVGLFVHDKILLSDNIIFMVSVALMAIYFKETRKIGIILIILGVFAVFADAVSGLNSLWEIYVSIGVSMVISLIIYRFKDNLTGLNQIIKASYYILR